MLVRVSSRVSAALRCAFCYGAADGADECARCGTLLHPDCRALAGGCTTLGCHVAPIVVVRAPRPWWQAPWAHAVLILALLAGFMGTAVIRFRQALDRANHGAGPIDPEITARIPGG